MWQRKEGPARMGAGDWWNESGLKRHLFPFLMYQKDPFPSTAFALSSWLWSDEMVFVEMKIQLLPTSSLTFYKAVSRGQFLLIPPRATAAVCPFRVPLSMPPCVFFFPSLGRFLLELGLNWVSGCPLLLALLLSFLWLHVLHAGTELAFTCAC